LSYRGGNRRAQAFDRAIDPCSWSAAREQAIQLARKPRPVGETRLRELIAQRQQRSV
jgi:hypothetical protein